MGRVSIKEHSCRVKQKLIHVFTPLCTCRALLDTAQGGGRLLRVSIAQHSIPEQRHCVCDDDVAQGSWGRKHVIFKRKEWTQLANHPFGEYVDGQFDICLP